MVRGCERACVAGFAWSWEAKWGEGEGGRLCAGVCGCLAWPGVWLQSALGIARLMSRCRRDWGLPETLLAAASEGFSYGSLIPPK